MLTQARLKELLHYDPETGGFTRINSKCSRFRGITAGTVHSTPNSRTKYINIRVDGLIHKAHRLAWMYVHGRFPIEVIDHIDGNGLNNCLANLRECSISENRRNVAKYSNNTSGSKNVSFHKRDRVWYVRFRIDGELKHFGRFSSREEAYIMARQVRQELHGSFANHG